MCIGVESFLHRCSFGDGVVVDASGVLARERLGILTMNTMVCRIARRCRRRRRRRWW